MISTVDRVIETVELAAKDIFQAEENKGVTQDRTVRVATILNLLFAVMDKASTDPDFPAILAAVALDQLMSAEAPA